MREPAAPPGTYTIEFDEWVRLLPEGIDAYALQFRVTTPSGEARAARLMYTDLQELEILQKAGFTTAKLDQLGIPIKDDAVNAVVDALRRLGVRRIEEAIAHGNVPTDYVWPFRVTEDDIETLVRLISEKRCRYQLTHDGDLYCGAASKDDPTAFNRIDMRIVAPTSRPLCAGCGVPDADYLCSHLTHPQVVASMGGAGVKSRMLMDAQCQRGRADVENPSRCRPEGNECWQRLVRPAIPKIRETVSPLAVAEAVDHLGNVWRLQFGKQSKLFQLRSAHEIAGLTLPCATREEFESRMSDMADLLATVSIPDDLLPAGERETDGALNRLKVCLRDRLPGEEFEPVEAAIDALRKIVTVRVALQHSGAQPQLKPALEALGLVYPLDEYAVAWDAIRGIAVDSLVTIRRAVQRLVDESTA